MLISDKNIWGHFFKVRKPPPQYLIPVMMTKRWNLSFWKAFLGSLQSPSISRTSGAFGTVQGAAPDLKQLYLKNDRRKGALALYSFQT